jgi:ferritin
MEEVLVNFLIDLNDKGLINNHDFDYEKVAKAFANKDENKQLIIANVVSSATECRHNSKQEKLNFVKWYEFAENEIANGRKQIQCSKCKKWYFPSEM